MGGEKEEEEEEKGSYSHYTPYDKPLILATGKNRVQNRIVKRVLPPPKPVSPGKSASEFFFVVSCWLGRKNGSTKQRMELVNGRRIRTKSYDSCRETG